jgi:CheY-like chemotaxis protein
VALEWCVSWSSRTTHGCPLLWCVRSAPPTSSPTRAGVADDALWMVHAASYDVIVLDVMLPDIDGFADLPTS